MCGRNQLLTVTASSLANVNFLNINPVSVTVCDGVMCYSAIYQPKELAKLWGKDSFDFDTVIRMLDKLLCASTMQLCLGFTPSNDAVNVDRYSWPYEHMRSTKCSLLYIITPDHRFSNRCCKCSVAQQYVRRCEKRKLKESPSRKAKRARVDSKCAYTYLTPRTKKLRLSRARRKRFELTKAVHNLTQKIQNLVTLNNEQSDEMNQIVHIINNDFSEDLNSVITSKTNVTQQEAFKKIWENDVRGRHSKDIADFKKDQARNRNGARSNKWSAVTYRVGLAVYCRSPAAYRALSSFSLLKLPSCSSVKGKCKNYNEQPGINHAYLWEQKNRYEVIKDESARYGQKVPVAEGVLIFDEVKVVEKIMWNSKNHGFQGLAMDDNELMHINDIVAEDREPEATKYVLQFLWRDLSHKFDVIGPYFTSRQSLTESYLSSCLLETMSSLHSYGFSVTCLVCDGASSNLTVVKAFLGMCGSIGFSTSGDKRDYSVRASFQNSFEGRLCHVIICPSHQLKNMVSALHSSRVGGSKSFVNDSISFGWSQIRDLKT